MTPLVDPQWLQVRLNDPNTIALDATLPPVGITPPVDTRAAYLAAHIPGAVFFDIDEISDHATSLPHMLPTAEEFARKISALGIAETMTLVIYEQSPVFSAPRAWWMLRTLGAHNVHLLDGGLPAWRAAGLPVEAGPVSRPPTSFRAQLDRTAIQDFAAIQTLIATGSQIVDARSAGRFAGSAPEPRPGLRSGHMPGSINVPFTEIFAEGRIKSPAALRALFESKGLDLTQPITTTCGSGVTAAVLKLALEEAGARQVTLYDGAWAEYAQQPQATIQTG